MEAGILLEAATEEVERILATFRLAYPPNALRPTAATGVVSEGGPKTGAGKARLAPLYKPNQCGRDYMQLLDCT